MNTPTNAPTNAHAGKAPAAMTQQQQMQLAKMLEDTALAFSGAIDNALTLKGLELSKLPPEIVASSQLSALLLTAARRTVRGGYPDIMLFTALRETLTMVRKELEEELRSTASPAPAPKQL